MKIYLIGLLSVLFSFNSEGCEYGNVKVLSCSLPGKTPRQVTFCMNEKTEEIHYYFKRHNKKELSVLFNKENNLNRFVDKNLGVTYFGFLRGQYSYVLGVINGKEKEEYSMFFYIKKDDKEIQYNDCNSDSYRSSNIVSAYINDVYIDTDKWNDFAFP